MRINWGPTVTAGITASAAIVIFMIVIPQIMGMGMIDVTRDMGNVFNQGSPYIAGAVALSILGIVWAMVYSSIQSLLPGNYISKGLVYGVIVGLFSMVLLPQIIESMHGMISGLGSYEAIPFSMNLQTLIALTAYMAFGIVLALNLNTPDVVESH